MAFFVPVPACKSTYDLLSSPLSFLFFFSFSFRFDPHFESGHGGVWIPKERENATRDKEEWREIIYEHWGIASVLVRWSVSLNPLHTPSSSARLSYRTQFNSSSNLHRVFHCALQCFSSSSTIASPPHISKNDRHQHQLDDRCFFFFFERTNKLPTPSFWS